MACFRTRAPNPKSCMSEIWSLNHFLECRELAPPTELTVLPYDRQKLSGHFNGKVIDIDLSCKPARCYQVSTTYCKTKPLFVLQGDYKRSHKQWHHLQCIFEQSARL